MGREMSFHGSSRQPRNPSTHGAAVNVHDLDPNANDDKIVNFVHGDDPEGRNGAVVLYSQSNLPPEDNSLKMTGPDRNFSGRSFAVGTHASGGTGGLNPGQPQGYPDHNRSDQGLVGRLGNKSKSQGNLGGVPKDATSPAPQRYAPPQAPDGEYDPSQPGASEMHLLGKYNLSPEYQHVQSKFRDTTTAVEKLRKQAADKREELREERRKNLE